MDETALAEAVRQVPVFARVSPDHKLRIVKALPEQGEVVPVTGDGVNDGPALKAASVGVAMGRSGTDVAKEPADVVATDDNCASIVAGVEEGRIVFDNVRLVTFFLVSCGVGEIVAILASIFFGFEIPLLPAQLLWLNLVTNGIQDVALAFEPGEKNVLKRRPRGLREGTISRELWERTLLTGAVLAGGMLLMFLIELDGEETLDQARTVALTTMVLFQVFHVGNCRSETRSIVGKSPFGNPFLLMGTAIALSIHIGAVYFGPAQSILRLDGLSLENWAMMIAVASRVLLVNELHKLLRRRTAAAEQKSEIRSGRRKLTEKVTRVYADMVADLFHYGHVEFLRQARELGDVLIVGVHPDEILEDYKRRPILTMAERIASVAGCRYVDEILANAPLVVDRAWIEAHDIHLVVHGDDFTDEQRRSYYAAPLEMGIFRTVPYTAAISTTEILRRCREA